MEGKTMTWTIYLLSILDGFGRALTFASGFSFVFSMLGYMILVCIAAGLRKTSLEDRLDDEDRSVLKFCESNYSFFKKVLVIAAPLWVLSFFIPTRDDFVESYMMVEGSKVVSAETSKEAADAVLKRIDRLIGAVEKATK